MINKITLAEFLDVVCVRVEPHRSELHGRSGSVLVIGWYFRSNFLE
jgi:hypothetical protein